MTIETPFYARVPKDRLANLRFRRQVIAYGARSLDRAQDVWTMCARDPLFYINTFAFLQEPRDHKVVEWITYDYQDRAILTLLESVGKRDVCCFKSRDMGATWVCLIALEWLWHFHDNYSFLLLSRKEELVDRTGDPKALFTKLDFLHGRRDRAPGSPGMPGWLMPAVDRTDKHLLNYWTGSVFDGESTNTGAGVGDRRSAVLCDELARMENAQTVVSGLRDVTRSRIYNFTAFPGAVYAQQLTLNESIAQIRMPWQLHPEKGRGLYTTADGKVVHLDRKRPVVQENYPFRLDGKVRSPWYDAEELRCANRTEVDCDLDMRWVGGGAAAFDSVTLDRLVAERCCDPYVVGALEFEPPWEQVPMTWEPEIRFVERPGGMLMLWCHLGADRRPSPMFDYCIGSDISLGTVDHSGRGASNSSHSVWNRQTGEKVAEYTVAGLEPRKFAHLGLALAMFFTGPSGPALLKWERNGPGVTYGQEVMRLGFRRVYWRKNEFSLTRKVQSDMTPGWQATPDNKREAFRQYSIALNSGSAINRSKWALEEARQYVYDESMVPVHLGSRNALDPTQARDNHGDRVVADALGWSEVLLNRSADNTEQDGPPRLQGFAARRRQRTQAQRDATAKRWGRWKRSVAAW